MPPSKTSPRKAALACLDQILGQGRIMTEAAEAAGWAELAPQDRAAARRLTIETLRDAGRADALLRPLLSRRPPTRIMNILRLATIELARGGADYGVVSAAVDLAASNRRTAPMKGLVNAVLRKVAAMDLADWDQRPPTRLPDWLRKRLVAAWGKGAVARIERAHAAVPPTDITVKAAPEAWAERLAATLTPTGSLRLVDAGQVSALPGYETGDWWVQDAAAALPATLFGDVAGLAVLDICAAPGGKTMQLAAAGADVTALDISETRLDRLRENLNRAGLEARVVAADALTFSEGPFDRILLDAPCTATGTIRRHPDLPYVKSHADVKGLANLQRQMLEHALMLLRPGGELVYCTCSLLPDEGEAQIRALLSQRSDVRVIPPARNDLDPAWTSKEGGIRLRPDYWPELGGMDGFYMARLKRVG